MNFTLTLTVELNAPPHVVWERVSTMHGVNGELWPLLRMTVPPDQLHVSFVQVPTKRVFITSWLLLFGFLPFDRHNLQFESVWEGGFREHSSSLMQRTWQHERTIVPAEHGAVLTDTLTFAPRIALTGFLVYPLIGMLFRHRHAQLRKLFA